MIFRHALPQRRYSQTGNDLDTTVWIKWLRISCDKYLVFMNNLLQEKSPCFLLFLYQSGKRSALMLLWHPGMLTYVIINQFLLLLSNSNSYLSTCFNTNALLKHIYAYVLHNQWRVDVLIRSLDPDEQNVVFALVRDWSSWTLLLWIPLQMPERQSWTYLY